MLYFGGDALAGEASGRCGDLAARRQGRGALGGAALRSVSARCGALWGDTVSFGALRLESARYGPLRRSLVNFGSSRLDSEILIAAPRFSGARECRVFGGSPALRLISSGPICFAFWCNPASGLALLYPPGDSAIWPDSSKETMDLSSSITMPNF